MSRGAASGLIAALAALTLLLPGAAAAQQPQASLPDIEDEVMCPICGTALNLSESPQAEAERAFIRERIAAGDSKEEIKDALVAEYGPEVLAVPDTSGFDLAAWLVPGLAILIAAGALAVGVRRWRRQPAPAVPAEEAGTDPDDERRLEADLKRYEL